MTDKHVLIIVENLPVPPDYRVWQIARTLRDEGVKVSVICPATQACPKGMFEIENITVYRHSMPREPRAMWLYIWEYIVALWYELFLSIHIYRKNKFHAIHACNPPDVIWIIALFWRIAGVKFVYDHHDLCPELYLTKYNVAHAGMLSGIRKCTYLLLRLMEKISQKCAHAVIVTNKTFARRAIERNKIPEEKVTVVRTGPRDAEVPEEPPPYTPTHPLRIGYVGVMARQDGVDGILRIASYLAHSMRREFTLILMGDGPERRRLEQLAYSLHLENSVEFRGFIPREQMFKELSSCLIGVTPDPPGQMNNASTMLKVLEYMTRARAQVMYDLAENHESAGDTAVYAEPGDEKDFAKKLADLLDNPEKCAELGRAAYARVATLTWEKVGAPPLIKVYKGLLKTQS